ncbi:MAG: AAA family ATPase, partial [Elusimicrobia bacterium]|nr:AAA family ATPase [Elusimicrobiota bacterium]
YRPARDRYKIYILDEAHQITDAAFNALLKTLEEPPAHVVFILATTEAAKIPATIVSRCQRFRFRPVPVDMLKARLTDISKKEKIKAEPEALELLARAAGGALRDAVGLLDQAQAFGEGEVTAAQVVDLLGTLPDDALRGIASALLAKDAPALAERLDKILEEGYDPAQIARDLRDRFQAAFLHRLGVRSELDEAWKTLSAPHGAPAFSYLVARMNRTLEQLRSEDSPRLVLEQALFGALEPAVDLAQWVERLESLEKRLASGAPPASAAPRPAPQAAPRPAPAPAPAAPMHREPSRPSPAAPSGSSDVWSSVISQLREEKPGLAAYLETARLQPQAGAEWKLLFKRSFELEQAKRSLPVIEAKLATVTGKAIRLSLEVGAVMANVATSAAAVDGPDEAPPSDPAAEDPGVKKVLEVFSGKVKQVKKKPGA